MISLKTLIIVDKEMINYAALFITNIFKSTEILSSKHNIKKSQ